jgi:hypothetical protein
MAAPAMGEPGHDNADARRRLSERGAIHIRLHQFDPGRKPIAAKDGGRRALRRSK